MSDALRGAGDPASKVAPAQLAMFVEKALGPLREGEDFLAAWWLGAKANRQRKSGAAGCFL